MPRSKTAWPHLRNLEDRALLGTMPGQHDEVVRHLEPLLARRAVRA